MGNIEDYRAKQQELENTQKELKNTQRELDNKIIELRNAKNENEDKKSELIEELISEIENLKQNTEKYKGQIEDIKKDLNALQDHFNSINNNINGNPNILENNTTETAQSNSGAETAQSNSGAGTTQSTSGAETTQSTSGAGTTQSASVTETTQSASVTGTAQSTSGAETTQSTSVTETTQSASENIQSNIELNTYEGYTKALSQLIFEIDGCTATAKYKRGLNQSGKETLKTAKAKLKQYKDIISDKKRMLEHELKEKDKLNNKNPDKAPLTLSISGAEINELKNRRFEWRQQIEVDIKEGQNGKSSNTAPRPNQSLEQVIKGNRIDSHHNEYDLKLKEALNDNAFLNIIDNNQDKARAFLQAIANNSLSDAQITICQVRKVELDPYFEKYGLTDQVHRCIQTRGGRYTQNYQNYGNMDLNTAYKTGGVTGWLNSLLIKGFPNAKPEQVSNFTNIAVAAGGIYAIYRIGKWFFGKNEKGERNLGLKTLGLAGIYFAPQLLVGKDGFSLLGDILSGKADFGELGYRASNCLWFMNNSSPEVYTQMAPGVLGMSIFPQTYTVKDVRSLQQTFSDQNARKQRYSVTYNRLNKDNSALANEFKNTFNANQYNENERKAFLAKLGITDSTSEDTIIFNEAMKLTDKKTSLELWMKSQGKKRNPAFKKEIDEYLEKDGEFNPEDFKEHTNRFIDENEAKYTMREEDRTNKEALENQVESLPLDSQKKYELKIAVKRFYDERNIDTKPKLSDFSLKMENGSLILNSRKGQKAEINVDTRELKGFGKGDIRFSNLAELLNVADISNKILLTQKGKTPKGLPAFEYKIGKGGRGIYFNDADTISFDFDTRVLSGGWGGKIGEIKTLGERPNEYATYLSHRRIESNKINIEASQYPMIKKLSESGINFFNEEEVKNAETRLNKVKELRSMANKGTQGYKPFSIEGNKLVFSTSDTKNATKLYFPDQFPSNFSGKSQNLSNFPTILNNKNKFLEFMNNYDNGMRGSKLNQPK